MTSVTEGQDILISDLYNMPGRPAIQLPNGPNVGLPRFLVQLAGASQRPLGQGRFTEADPSIMVRVETDAAGGSDAAVACQNLVRDLVAYYPKNRRIKGLTILTAPSVRSPLPVSGGVFSIPVFITGRVYF